MHSEQQRRAVPRFVHFSLLRAGLLLVFLTCLTARWSSQFQIGKEVAGFLKLQQQLLAEFAAILTKVDETKDFTQLVNRELLQCLCLSRGTEKTGQSFQHAQSPLENFLHLSGY